MQDHIPSGKQTQITPQIQKLTSSFSSSGLELIFDILRWIDSEIQYRQLEPNEKKNFLYNRTAEEIINSKFSSGCTDPALVFVALCRAKKIITEYLELLDLDWLRGKQDHPIRGHAIAKITISGKKYFVDPINCNISTKFPSGKKVYSRGLDPWDMGINHRNWNKKFIDYKEQFTKGTEDGGI